MALPPNTVLPLFYVDFSPAAPAGAGALVRPSVILAQQTAAGTAPPLLPYRVSSAAQAAALFGVGSQAHLMAAAYLVNHPTGALFVIGAEDAAGTAATGTVVFEGSATAAGTVALYVAGQRVTAAVAVSAAATAVAASVAAAINANTSLPVTAAAATGTVTVTAKHAGAIGNGITLRLNAFGPPEEALPAGITATVAATLTSGATDPAPADWITALGNTGYDEIVPQSATTAELNALRDEMERRWGAVVKLQGHVWAGAHGDVDAALALVAARNDWHLSALVVDPAAGWLSTPGEYAAALAGVAARYLGAEPGRPLQTLRLQGVFVGRETEWTDRNALAYAGGVTLTEQAGRAYVEYEATTYRTDTFGGRDEAVLVACAPYTAQRIGRRMQAMTTTTFPRHSLANDGTRFNPDLPITTPRLFRGEVIGELTRCEADGLVEDLDAWQDNVTVDRVSGSPDQLTINLPTKLIKQFRRADFNIQFGS